MKKLILSLLVLMISNIALAKVSVLDTIIKPKPDTIRVPVPVYEKYDTVKITAVLYGASNGSNMVLYELKPYIIMKGFAVETEKGKWQWTTQPKVEAVLSADKKRHINNFIQLIQ